MPNHTRTPRPKDAELAGYLAGTLARRCAHLALPILTQHESAAGGLVTTSRQRLMDAAENFNVSLSSGVVLNIPSGQSVLRILEQSFLEAPHSLMPDNRSSHLAIWDHQACPDSPDAIIRFMDAARGPASRNLAVIVGLADSPQTSPIIEFLDRHFGGRVPLFRLHGETLVLHSPEGCHLILGAHAVAGLLAVTACFQPFQDLVGAVQSVEPDEAESLRQIFKETFTPITS